MSEEKKDSQEEQEKRYLDTLIESLSYLVKEKIYGPLDVLASTPDPQLAYGVLYNAIRYLVSQEYPVPSENDLNIFFAIAKKQPEILREVAIKALTRGAKMRVSENKSESKTGEKREARSSA